MKHETLREAIIAEINEMTAAELVDLNNTYCDSAHYFDNHVYSNDELFFEMLSWDGLRIAQAITYGDYHYAHNWVTFNGYGNFQSYEFFRVENLVELVPAIADYIIDNYNDFEHLFTEDIFNLINEAQ